MVVIPLMLGGCVKTSEQVIVVPAPITPVCPNFLTEIHIGSRLSQLVPSAPDRAVFCKYAGMNEKVNFGTLVRVVAVSNPSALAKLLNQTKPVPKEAAFSCPADFGDRDAIFFAKAEKRTTVIIPTSGCHQPTSTNTSGTWLLSKAAIAALQKLDPALSL